jgi:hypothetical protein
MIIRLAHSNPHPITKNDPRSQTVRRILDRWWGREIIVGLPRRPRGETICGTAMVWPIIGPQELLTVLAFHNLAPVTCVHCLQVAQLEEEADYDRIAV